MASKVTTGGMEDEAPMAKPVDKGRLVQISFFLLGIGMLLPWNLFITATTFFGLRFEGSPFADNFSKCVMERASCLWVFSDAFLAAFSPFRTTCPTLFSSSSRRCSLSD